jgi:hypothetical protein
VLRLPLETCASPRAPRQDLDRVSRVQARRIVHRRRPARNCRDCLPNTSGCTSVRFAACFRRGETAPRRERRREGLQHGRAFQFLTVARPGCGLIPGFRYLRIQASFPRSGEESADDPASIRSSSGPASDEIGRSTFVNARSGLRAAARLDRRPICPQAVRSVLQRQFWRR